MVSYKKNLNKKWIIDKLIRWTIEKIISDIIQMRTANYKKIQKKFNLQNKLQLKIKK
jgi:hypothetical protein